MKFVTMLSSLFLASTMASAVGSLVSVTAIAVKEYTLDETLAAIRMVESGDDPSAVGDGGRAIGCYQVWESYWKDAVEFSGLGGNYRDCYKRDYADRVVREYMKRYCTEKRLGREPTWEDIARMHNGGPRAVWATGKKKENLDRYVAKVKAQLEK
tara:strand:+ start:963 stop:1427 length:465 start_codon:yes stop_codon:yes gene_type:complete